MKYYTKNYIKKKIVSRLFNEKNYHKIKLYKIIFDYLLGRDYENCNTLFSGIIRQNYVVFDIGANQGQYACRLNKFIRSGKVYSFEPFNQSYISLLSMKKILKLNSVIPVHCALSDKKGKMKLKVPIINNSLVVGTQAVLENYQQHEPENAKYIEELVDVTTIDEYVYENKIDRVDFIKIDTEGAEIEVIKGGINTINKYSPILSMEIHPSSNELSLLFEMGYEVYIILEKKLVLYDQNKYNNKKYGNSILINRSIGEK